MDDRDEEIARLRADPKSPRSTAGSGFAGGFFGCFGVAVAVIVVVVLFLSLGLCSPREREAAVQAPVGSQTEEASHCVNGLWQAGEQGKVDPERSALAFPWQIERSVGAIACRAKDREKPITVTVRAICPDTDDEKCTELISVRPVPD